MKSPTECAKQLVRHWQSADWRERQLLGGAAAWPLVVPVGRPGAQVFLGDTALLRTHLQKWRDVDRQHLGRVHWEDTRYRGSSGDIAVPTHWELAKPSEAIAAISACKVAGHAQIRADYQRLSTLIAAVEHPGFRRLLVRRLVQWRDTPADAVIAAAHAALRLEPGCAQGKPLRALALAGNDSKFLERHAGLVTALLDERFGGDASRHGLAGFLGAAGEDEHWLLVAPLGPGLLPFTRLRVPASELQAQALPSRRILIVENERSLYQLPQPLDSTIAILGAGLNLGWLAARWLQDREVAYWGDLDTWGLQMLRTARRHLPHLQPLLMERATFDTHQDLAVPEPVPAMACEDPTVQHEDATLDAYLRTLPKGRLEQEFLPLHVVHDAVRTWASPQRAADR